MKKLKPVNRRLAARVKILKEAEKELSETEQELEEAEVKETESVKLRLCAKVKELQTIVQI